MRHLPRLTLLALASAATAAAFASEADHREFEAPEFDTFPLFSPILAYSRQ